MKQEIGALLHLYTDDLVSTETATPNPTHIANGRNWTPVLVVQTGAESFRVVGNHDVFAAAQEAGLNKVWCIICPPDFGHTEEPTEEPAPTPAPAPVKLSYRQLQTKLKAYRAQGHKVPKLNSSRGVLESALATLLATA